MVLNNEHNLYPKMVLKWQLT